MRHIEYGTQVALCHEIVPDFLIVDHHHRDALAVEALKLDVTVDIDDRRLKAALQADSLDGGHGWRTEMAPGSHVHDDTRHPSGLRA
jgi:hypothetical protein